jgi:hypothetical protein
MRYAVMSGRQQPVPAGPSLTAMRSVVVLRVFSNPRRHTLGDPRETTTITTLTLVGGAGHSRFRARALYNVRQRWAAL